MSASFFSPTDRPELLRRINALTPASQRQWGTMTVGQMLAHCADQVRVTSGQKPISTQMPGFLKKLVKWLMIDLMPRFPRNMGTLKELDANKDMTPPTTFEADRQTLLALIEPARYPEGQTFDHPAFGRLTRDDFGRATWKHLDHHLRQFGV